MDIDQRKPGGIFEHLAIVRQRAGLARADNPHGPEVLLQFPHLLADGCRGDAQRVGGGARKAVEFRSGEKRSEARSDSAPTRVSLIPN
jgi:hypothetical protein